jgi:hypothetical protein
VKKCNIEKNNNETNTIESTIGATNQLFIRNVQVKIIGICKPTNQNGFFKSELMYLFFENTKVFGSFGRLGNLTLLIEIRFTM